MTFLDDAREEFAEPTPERAPRVPDPFAGDPFATPVPTLPYVEAVIERFTSTTEGSRNHALNAAAYRLGQALGAGQLDRADIEAKLEAAAHESGYVASDGLAMVRGTIRSGLASGMAKPLSIPDTKERLTPPAAPWEVAVPAVTEGGTWRIPEPLHDALPDFPTAALGWLEPATLALSEQLQTPPDLVAMLLLATAGAAVRGKARIQVTPGWDEPLNLYVAVVLGAGETKSPALTHLTRPLREIEANLIEEARPRIADAEQKIRMQEKRLRQAEDRAVKATGDDRFVAEEEARQAALELANLPVIVSPRLLLGDVTPEGLVRMLAEQGGAIASLTAEGGLFDTFAAGRYSNGLANLDAILQAHDGREPILVDRKTGDPLRVERPCLTLGLAVQPQVLESIGENDAAVGRGFLARWLYAIPKSRVGARSVDNRVESPLLADFERAIKGTYQLVGGSSECFEGDSLYSDLRLSPSSIDIHREYRRALEARRHPYTGDLAEMVAWANKLDGQLARLAGLLRLLDLTEHTSLRKTPSKPSELDAVSVTVDEHVMNRAVLIADYLIAHARAAHRMMSPAYRDHADERQVLGWVARRDDPLAEFSVRDVHQRLRDRVAFHEVDAVSTAIGKLAARGYLAPIEAPAEKKPGRPPSPRFRVNPAILGEKP